MAAKSITIEIGNEFIKICEMQRTKKSVMVHHAISIQTPPDTVEDGFVKDITLVSETIKNAMLEDQILGNEVTFIINSSRVATKEVILPLVKKEKIQELVNINASEYFPVNIDDYVLSYTILENINTKEDKKSRVLVFAAPEAMIESYYSLAKVMGVKIKAVDYAGNSTLQLIKIQIDSKPTLVVQLGMDTTIVSVMNENILQLQRTIPYGESLLLNAVMESKKMSAKATMELLSQAKLVGDTLDADDTTNALKYLISNVNRVIEYYSGRNPDMPLQKLVIIGEGADVLGIDRLFTNETNLPSESLTLLKNVESYNRIKISNSLLKQYMANVGASLDPINFKPKAATAFAVKQKDSNNAIYMIGGIVLIVIAALLTAIPLFKFKGLENDKSDLNKNISKIQDVENLIKEYNKANDNYIDMSNFYISTVNDTEYVLDFIDHLEKSMPNDMKVSTFSISNGVADMNLVCSSKPEVANFVDSLNKNSNITKVIVSSIREKSDSVSFACKISFMTDINMKAQAEAESEAEAEAKSKTKTKTETETTTRKEEE